MQPVRLVLNSRQWLFFLSPTMRDQIYETDFFVKIPSSTFLGYAPSIVALNKGPDTVGHEIS